ncbi:Arm DNA-binding domain-containing protein [Novosphingobium sp. NDB2Meth1]|uniref:Arm DNA-binding domain-containing protein n=1 Tax=Novosphingobium sp. NDB2Meth1 TaxID=1892847 RepID=UPI000931DCE9|nr:Arm DNA-binding domain-containing protein [Novosphingobium sp. NDB2Meth1]
MADGGGMFLLITPAGGKLWRLKYRVDGREKLLAIGTYPEIGLGEARRRREEARELIRLQQMASPSPRSVEPVSSRSAESRSAAVRA